MEKYARLEDFDYETDDWQSYKERLEQLFIVNGHGGTEAEDVAARRATLLTVYGKKTYDLLKTLAAPNKPAEKSFDQLCQLLESHFSPKPSIIMRRFTFYTRDRKPNEAVNDYVAALRKLAMECDFAGSLEDNLRDRLVCGINEVSVQRKNRNRH